MNIKITLTLICLTIFSGKLFSQCNPANPYPQNPTQTTVQIFLANTSSGGTYYIEYGLAGFTPGTAGTAGPGGTLVASSYPSSNFVNISGLTPNTVYHVYCRKNCSGVWSANSTIVNGSTAGTFITAFDCNAATPIVCNTMNSYAHQTVYGAWNSTCPPQNQTPYGTEKVYSFTPTISGNHTIYIPANTSQALYKYKLASTACNDLSWTCIGQGPSYFGSNQPSQLTFGPLTAGVQYHILVDCLNYGTPVQTSTFRIECPYCPSITNVTAGNIDPVSATLTWSGFGGTQILEYGPEGFIPGTGSSAGVNGTILFVGGSSYTLTGLTPQTGYDVYIRRSCAGGTYSPNSVVCNFGTKWCPNSVVYPSTGSPAVQISFTSGPGNYDHVGNCASGFTPTGQEQVLRFTAPSTGSFELTVNNNISFNPVNYQVAISQNCAIYSATCLYPFSTSNGISSFSTGALIAGNTYDIIFDIDTTVMFPPFYGTTMVATISCPKPTSISSSNIQPNSVNLNWSCSPFLPCQSPPILEYGPEGFTPGTGSVAGTNGTIISGAIPPYTLSGLTSSTRYDVYLRSNCGGMFSANTTRLNFKTAFDCATASVLTCGSYDYYSVSMSSNPNNGSWTSAACVNSNNLAPEKVWKFTPAQNGTYSLYFYSFYANSTGYTYTSKYYIKQQSLLCNESNWSCVGTLNWSMGSQTPAYLSLGNLTAGTSYYIMADGVQPTNTQGYTYYFRMECPGFCPGSNISSVTAVTGTSATLNGACPSCTGPVYIEYGPAGFVPGTDSNPGVFGTVISNVTFPYNLTGLTTGVTYDVYTRTDCGLPAGFSPNSTVITFTPCFTTPTGITSNIGNNTICLGGSITLTQNGGVLPPGGSYVWYSGSCGTTLAGTGNSITVSPIVNTTYRVRIESSCGISSCSGALTVTVNTPDATITPAGPTSFCAGGSVILNANTGTGLTYQWKNGGVNIPGQTGASYTASASGSYSVVVINSSGCSRTSAATVVTVNLLPNVYFTGLAASYTNADPAATLTGVPLGGIFSGPGISGNTFSPSVAGVGGPYTILYSYTDGNGCFNSSSQQTTVTGCTGPPAQPGSITTTGGAAPVCPSDSKTYSISAVLGASSYTWTPPAGGTVTSGQGTVSVTVNYGAGFTAAGNLIVVATNNCGTSAQRTLQINRNNPVIPSSITGNATGLCSKTGEPFSVPAIAGITNNWSFNNSNITVASGQGTNAITANFNAAFTTTAILSVTASNGCGTSAAKTLTVAAKPATPGAITGALTVCANQQGVPYSIVPLYGVTTYTWVSPKKSHPSDGIVTSNNTNLTTTANAITVNYGNSGGYLKVRGNNACGSSAYLVTNITMNCRVMGEAETAIPEISLYPNPARDEINVIVSGCETFEIEMFNALGETVLYEQNKSLLNLSAYREGIYMIRVNCGGKTFHEKVIINR